MKVLRILLRSHVCGGLGVPFGICPCVAARDCEDCEVQGHANRDTTRGGRRTTRHGTRVVSRSRFACPWQRGHVSVTACIFILKMVHTELSIHSESTRKCVINGVIIAWCIVEDTVADRQPRVHTWCGSTLARPRDSVQGPETDQEDQRDTERLLMTLSHCARGCAKMVPSSARPIPFRARAR